MTVQIVDLGGERHALMPIADYERLIAEFEDRADENAASKAEKRRLDGEEYLPSEMVDRLMAGESKLRVWRKYRGFTLDTLAKKAGISIAYAWSLEKQKSHGNPKVWRALSAAMAVDVDDIMPDYPA